MIQRFYAAAIFIEQVAVLKILWYQWSQCAPFTVQKGNRRNNFWKHPRWAFCHPEKLVIYLLKKTLFRPLLVIDVWVIYYILMQKPSDSLNAVFYFVWLANKICPEIPHKHNTLQGNWTSTVSRVSKDTINLMLCTFITSFRPTHCRKTVKSRRHGEANVMINGKSTRARDQKWKWQSLKGCSHRGLSYPRYHHH